jgi:hypothetical protein
MLTELAATAFTAKLMRENAGKFRSALLHSAELVGV